MKLTKKLEAKVLKTYNGYWDSYLRGDMKAMASFLDNDYKVIGSTDAEVFYSKKAAMKFYSATADQIAETAQLRNRDIKIDLIDGLVLITEKMDFYVLIDGEWTFYAKGRLSSLLRKKEDGWKFIQQHGSMPDTRAQEGEQVAVKKISKENLELRDAIKRRTVELENKNRELEIETALEKVRAIAMSMKEPADMLDVCKAISLQLQSLDVKEIRNVQTAIFYQSRGTYMNYEYYAKHKKAFITETGYTNHKVGRAFAKKMLQGKGEIFITHIKGKKVKDWIAYQKTTNVFIDRFLEKASSLNYYWHSLGPVALGISTYSPLNKEELNLFNRFLNVFELAYTRYLDIEQAITQAKEAKIEASLEKVRAQALGMRKPDDLPGICEVLFAELQVLGFAEIRNAMINIHNDDNGSFINYDYSDEIGKSINHLLYNIHPLIEKQIKQIRSAGDAFSETSFKGKDLKDWKAFRKKIGEKDDPRIEKTKALYYYFYSIGTGSIGISTFSSITEEKLNVLKRFRNVFDFAYRRYMDVAQAEAQSREAQIELALERVRARTMAMQKSDELAAVSSLLFQQLKSLGVNSYSSGFTLWDNNNNDLISWMCNADGSMNPPFTMPVAGDAWHIRQYESWKNGEDFIVNDMAGELMQSYFRYLRSFPLLDEAFEKSIAAGHPMPERQVHNVANFSHGNLLFITLEPCPEAHDIFKRFAKVFEQTYTRFLDLQKSEAQARESQIQLALERVRARTMAMQRSDELAETAVLLFQQLKSLGLDLRGCGFNIWEKNEKTCTTWMSGPEGTLSPPFNLPLTENTFFIRYYESRQNEEDFWVYETGREELVARYEYMRTLPVLGELLAKDQKDGMEPELPPFVVDHVVNFSNGNLIFITNKHHPEAWDIFRRFGKVFEQTYTRFLDLQKAEAQAREAKIEAALERVRSRTMAMQHSDELQEVSTLLFKQVQSFGVEAWSCGFNIWENDGKDLASWMCKEDGTINPPFKVPIKENPRYIHSYEAWQKGEPFYWDELQGEDMEAFYRYLRSIPIINYVLESNAKAGFILPASQVHHVANFSHGYLMFITYKPCPEVHDIFKRFAAVFEQTYTRFLDLQKAEAQARESQIQLALERVRARTMAMQHSDELKDAAALLFQQIADLGTKQWSSGFDIWNVNEVSAVAWMSNPDGSMGIPFTVPYTEDPFFKQIYEARQSGKDFFVMESSGKELEETYQYLFNLPEAKKHFDGVESLGFQMPKFQITNCAFFSQGYLMFITFEAAPEMWDIFKRFAKVFEQTYTRFLDLQKSEAQARESQIQLAMERVRARTMAMQRSEELTDTAAVIFHQIKELGIHQWGNSFQLWEDDMKAVEAWTCTQGIEVKRFKIPTTEDTVMINIVNAAQKGEILYVEEMGGEVLEDHYKFMYSLPIFKEILDNLAAAGITPPKFQVMYAAYFSYGYILFITHEPNPEAQDIFKRFAKVFEQTYTRFLDLQKSEAQAREAQIEAALERVRSRTMAMQRSDELANVATVLFQQVKALGVPQWTCGFSIFEIDDKEFTWYPGSPDGDILPPVKIPLTEHPVFISFNESRKRGDELFVYEKGGEFQADHYRYMQTLPGIGGLLQKMLDAGLTFPTFQIDHVANFSHGNLMFITYEHFPEMHDVFKRFAKVFEQTYTRFLDLQKAESQAREAKIETALEKVRSRTMAMQKSEDLQDTAFILFQQVQALDVQIFGCGFNIWDDDRKAATAWMAREDGLAPPFKTSSAEDVFFHIHEAAQRGESLFVREQGGEELETHYRYMATLPVFKEVAEKMAQAGFYFPTFQIIHCAFFSQGYLMFISYGSVPEAHDIFKRFAKVFEQTYTRFLDLQKAEAQALEAIKRASVDRVRAEIASMRTTSDLERITPLIWNELTTLGVPFIRCGVFIMDDEQQEVQSFLSTPDGNAIAAFRQPYSALEISNVVDSWHKKEMYKQHWDEAQFIEFTKNLVQQGSITIGEKYLTENRPTDLYLHFLPFLQGMLYAGNTSPFSDDELQLVQNLADAFSTAYARYEDFNKLEAAKKQVDGTLNELQATQKQLIQSEKMASLGELTAGIAHEIQNPLNFVNNFSEVSTELLDEMITELGNDNKEDAIAIAGDVKQNLEKILHHGKRADGIVKGMLQHSRSSSAIKEPTDINKLADEYLRLAYHGLRAKDKSFNATLITDYDESIGNINIIPQDIGRAVLNLITNAFYAAPLPPEGGFSDPDYKHSPTIWVSTKKLGDKVLISVRDNGPGIPQKILDKIFQPFFTTKPTGQGTGLGLSLSYDIIKAHGGELKVETNETEGSEFIISLPG